MLFSPRSFKQNTVPLLLLPLLAMGQGEDWYFAQRAGLMWFMALCAAVYFWKKYGALFGVFAGYCLASVIYVCFWRSNHFAAFPKELHFTIQRASLLGAFGTLLIWLVVSSELISHAWLKRVLCLLGAYVCLHYWFLKGFYAPEGHLMGWSTAGIFLALIFPWALGKNFYLAAFIAISGIAMGKHTALACFMSIFFVYIWAWRKRLAAYLAGFSVVGAGIALTFYTNAVLKGNGNGRFPIWKMAYTWICEQGLDIWGAGAGTVYTLVPFLQVEKKVHVGYYWTYLHSDVLQCFFELGAVGLVCSIFLYLRAWQVMRSVHEAAFLAALLPASMTFFVFRHETLLLTCALWVHGIFSRSRTRLDVA